MQLLGKAKLRRILIQDFNSKVTLHNLENFDLMNDSKLTNASFTWVRCSKVGNEGLNTEKVRCRI